MEPLATGQLVDGCYRIDALLHESPRATVYAVTHVRFEGTLVLKVVPLERAGDFERDTNALATLTTAAVARVCDRGVLPDGRPYRVVERLAGPTLASALTSSAFTDDRVMEILVDLAATVFEARGNGIGPCDLSVDNLMFAAEGGRRLCMLRILAPDAQMPDPEADQTALVALRGALERGRETALTKAWKPPSSISELPSSPPVIEAGTTFPGGWRVIKKVSETVLATVYTVVGPNDVRGMLKIAGPSADPVRFRADGKLLARVRSPHVVRVFDQGIHGDAPFYVMQFLPGRSLAARRQETGTLDIDTALRIVDDLLVGAEALAQAGGGPADFSLAQCFESATADRRPILLTQTTTKAGRFHAYAGQLAEGGAMDSWSAAVAFYELVAGRSPFPVSRRSMMQVWLGMPKPLADRRAGVPPNISLTINQVISGTISLRRDEMRAQLAAWRKGVAEADFNERMSIEPPLPVGPRVEIRQQPIAIVVAPSHVPAPPPPALDWQLEASPTRCPIAPILAAAIREDGSEMVAVSADAIARYRRGAWSIDPARDVGRVGRIVPISDKDYLALTTDRRLFRLGASGTFKPWGATLARHAFFGIAPFDDGRDSAWLVGGSTDWGHGMVARLDGESITIVAEDVGVRTLYAATSVPDGSFIAVGARGSMVRLRGGAVIESGVACDSDLYDVKVLGPEILVVGANAWVFRVKTASLAIDVEPVDTTSNLTCLATHAEGQAWIGSDRGRILRRREGHWRRMNRPFAGDPAVMALQVSPTNMGAVLADGTIVLGQQVRPRS